MDGVIKCLFAIVVINFYMLTTTSQDACNHNSGPPGTRCVILPSFDDFQLAKCTTPDHVMQVSNGTLTCADSCRQYCWLPCMAEKYGQINGTVRSECSCQPSIEWCFRETGSCSFYSECLPERFNCTSPGFADFIFAFCTYISSYISELETCNSKDWLREYRICLQRSLIPDILQNDSATCNDVEQRGFEIAETCLDGVCSIPAKTRTYLEDVLVTLQSEHASGVNKMQGAFNCTS